MSGTNETNSKEDLIGKTFGNLTVLDLVKSSNGTLCQCRCACGNTALVRRSWLVSGRRTTCGCRTYQKDDPRANVKEDLTGKRFGRLVVLERSGHIGAKVAWLCKCDCGNTKRIRGEFLRRGSTTSCGCYHSEVAAKAAREAHTFHGDARSRLYGIWHGMKTRCNDLNDPYHAKDYSTRGITYCDEWEVYEPFRDWALSHGYRDDLTLDRIDVNGNYCPENCRWTTMTVQQRNKRNNRYIEWNGETCTLSEWSERTGISSSVISRRLKQGWNVGRALSVPPRKPINLRAER